MGTIGRHRELVALEPGGARRCVTVHLPARPTGRRVIFCPPLGGEQLLARGPIHRIAERLAEEGHVTVVYDPIGHGDSEGEFAELTLERLGLDLAVLARHPALDSGADVVVGVRFGAAVAAVAIARGLVVPKRLVLVAPVLRGEDHARELLQRNVEAQIASHGRARRDAGALASYLERGLTVEVDGHPLGEALHTGIARCDAAAMLARREGIPIDVVLVRSPRAPSTPADAAELARAHRGVTLRTVDDHAFWRDDPNYVVSAVPHVAEAVVAGIAGVRPS